VPSETEFVATPIEGDFAPRVAISGLAQRTETLFFWWLIAVVALMPLPFGSARPWAWSLAAVAVGLLALAYSAALAFVEGFRPAVPFRRLRLPLLLLTPAVLWAIFQALPIGSSELAHPVWQVAKMVLNADFGGRISVDPFATGTAIMRLLTYVTVFLLAVELTRSSERAKTALAALSAVSAIYAAYGLFAFFFTPDLLLWFPKTNYQGDLSSTFVNRNSYATFAGLGLLCAIGMLAKFIHRPALASQNRRVMAANLVRILAEKGWIPMAAITALVSAVVLTHSRGGFLSTGIGVLVLLFCVLTVGRLSRFGRALVAGVVLAGMVLIVHLSGEVTLERLGRTDIEREGRAAVFELVRQGISDAPLIGHGYGAFETAFQAYADETLDGYYPNAHNDYLELAFDLGLPASLFLIAAILAIAVACLAGVYRRRRDVVYPALAVAAAVLVGAHALVDFSLQMPAVAAFLAFLLGLGYSQSWTSADPDT
jgi:O-antigen ligase